MRKALTILSGIALAVAGFAGSAGAQPCGAIVGVNDGSQANDNITVDTVWGGVANPSPVCLEAPIFVQAGATLEILPGTIVRGQPRRALPGALAGTPGAIVVTQDGSIVSDGTANAPVIMTTAAVDNDSNGICDDLDANGFFDPHPGFDPASVPNPDPTPTFCDDTPTTAPLAPLALNGTSNVEMWGGMVVLGRAPTNLSSVKAAPGGHGFGFIEGLTLPGFDPLDAQCGGVEPHDSSGVIRYTSVRHAGDEIGNNNELNGVTLCAVGDGTILEFVEVYANQDDGFEWFGGTVNANHLVVTYAADDQLDIDWGYTGVIQYVLTMTPYFNQNNGSLFGSRSGDKVGELDGDDYNNDAVDFDINVRTSYSNPPFGGGTSPASINDTPWPLSNPYIWNWTAIGTTTDGANPAVSDAATNLGIEMRNGFAGQVLNSIIVNTGGACLVVDTDTVDSITGHNVVNNTANDLVRLVSSTCDSTNGAALSAVAGAAEDVADNGDAYALAKTGLACTANVRFGGGFSGLVQEDPTFVPTGDPADGKLRSSLGAPYNPRPTGATGLDCGLVPDGPGTDRAGTYRGAFPASTPAGALWTEGWTTLGIAGLLD